MKLNKRSIGFFAGVILFFIINNVPLNQLGKISGAGQTCLGLTLMTVVWWACQVAQPAFVGGIYCVLLILLKCAGPSVVFKSWTGSIMWMVIGAYLIAGAVKDSRLGERIAYWFTIKFVHTWKTLVISIFVLTFILSLLIPHPFPRAFLILAVMMVICDAAKVSKGDKTKIGFLVFAAAAPCSMFFLTGDASLNPLVVGDSGVQCTFVQWFMYMSVPMLIATLCTLGLGLFLFKPEHEISINVEEIKEKQKSLGKLSAVEIRTIVWLTIAIALWLTQGITGLDIGWITLIVALLMSMPVIGGILTPKSWSGVPINTLIFLTSAMAIGTVGSVTGMNTWIARVLLPANIPSNIFVLALLIAVVSIVIHMFMGSVMAVLGICIPAFVAFTSKSSISPLAISMMVFSAINIHYILPFHNLPILVGCGEEGAGYSSKEAIRMGVPLTAVVFIVVLAEAAWFHMFGLM